MWLRPGRTHTRPTRSVLAAHQALEWGGFVLPEVAMSGGAVFPVIDWTHDAGRRRVHGPDPTTCRPTLSDWEDDGPASAVRIVGFIHDGSPADDLDRLKAVAAYGPGAIVVANVNRVGRWTMAEADVAGISVVEVGSGRAARVALQGRRTALPTTRRSVATRLREEQLYDWALRLGEEPSCPVTSAESCVN